MPLLRCGFVPCDTKRGANRGLRRSARFRREIATALPPFLPAWVVRSHCQWQVVGSCYPLPITTLAPRPIQDVIEHNCSLVPDRIEARHAAAIDAAANRLSGQSRQLELGPHAGRHPAARFDQRAATTDVNEPHLLTRPEQCRGAPRRAIRRHARGLPPLRLAYSSCHCRSPASNRRTRMRLVAPRIRMAICGPAGPAR